MYTLYVCQLIYKMSWLVGSSLLIEYCFGEGYANICTWESVKVIK